VGSPIAYDVDPEYTATLLWKFTGGKTSWTINTLGGGGENPRGCSSTQSLSESVSVKRATLTRKD